MNTKCYSATELDSIHQSLFVDNKKDIPIGKSSNKLEIFLSNQINLRRADLTPALIHFLKEELNFLNTEYLTKRRLGKPVYKVQKYFKLIDEDGDIISLPRGFLQTLVTFLKGKNIPYKINHTTNDFEKVTYKNKIELMPLQIPIVETVATLEQGVIVAPPGSGKTIIGLELITRKQLPALILVHRKQLLDQWTERIQTFLGITKTHIGEYSGIKKKIGKQITVGLLQSLARKGDLSELRNTFGTVIVDECHHIPAMTFREVISQLNPKYMYGLTATPKRKHNDEKLIYVYIGEIIARMETSDTNQIPSVSKQPIKILVRTTRLTLPFTFSTDYFQLLAKVICFDTARNQMIIEDILSQIQKNNRVLVLSERKEHLEILNMYLKGKSETIVISGDDSAPKRKSKLQQIESGHYQIILSTGQFFGEGLDIKNISCLILAFPFAFEGKLIQYIGRLRDNGNQRTIIDYRDMEILFLEKQFKQRMRYYKKLNGKIEIIWHNIQKQRLFRAHT